MPDPAESIDPHTITLAILAGGAGSRMGAPKGSLQIHGQPILEHLLQRFAWTGPTMLVLAPGIQAPAGAERFNHVVCDPIEGVGPLRGVMTALENSSTEITIIATVDMPGVSQQHLAWIAQQLQMHPEVSGAMIVRPGGQIEPFPSAFRIAARERIAQQLQRGQRSVHGLLEDAKFIAAIAPADWGSEVWTNLNTPDDLAKFIRSS